MLQTAPTVTTIVPSSSPQLLVIKISIAMVILQAQSPAPIIPLVPARLMVLLEPPLQSILPENFFPLQGQEPIATTPVPIPIKSTLQTPVTSTQMVTPMVPDQHMHVPTTPHVALLLGLVEQMVPLPHHSQPENWLPTTLIATTPVPTPAMFIFLLPVTLMVMMMVGVQQLPKPVWIMPPVPQLPGVVVVKELLP